MQPSGLNARSFRHRRKHKHKLGPRHKPQAQANQNLVQVLKQQASLRQAQAASRGPDPVGHKLPYPGSFIKFYKVKASGLNQDICIAWMFHVEGNLMWGKVYFVGLCILKF